MSLRHAVLPPHAGVDEPLERLSDPTSPACILDRPRPWLTDGSTPRRAGVSAFGFGGTNFHAVLEEYRGAIRPSAPGADDWPCELVVVATRDDDALRDRLDRLRQTLRAGVPYRLGDLAYTCALEARQWRYGRRAAIVAETTAGLLASIEGLLDHLEGRSAALPTGVCLGQGGDPTDLEVAFLFPGQGVTASGLCRESAPLFDRAPRRNRTG